MGSQHKRKCLFCQHPCAVNGRHDDEGVIRITVDCPSCGASFERAEYLKLLKEGI
jgi:endogenous inhibitor of DNA gyrase (YacG/DUF329 family)